jgi:hypothetical protein
MFFFKKKENKMATALRRAIERKTGVSRRTTRQIRTRQLRKAMRRKSRGGKGG